MTSSEDGLTTVITVAAHPPAADVADVIDRAFRLQHLQPEHLTYEGPASVTHTLNQLMVDVGDARGWRFPVDGKPVIAGSTPTRYLEIPVRGLSQHWGAAIHRPHDEVVSTLLAGVCGATGGRGLAIPVRRADPGRACATSTAATPGAPPNATVDPTPAATAQGVATVARTSRTRP